jgi:hypothetical protein
MEPPTRDPSDSLIAYGAESGLFMPEEAKSTSTPKRFRHMISFAFLEVSFIGRIVRVGFALDLDASFNGRATGGQQPYLIRCPLVVTRFSEEVPVTSPIPFKVFRFEPARVFVLVSSSCPPPQTMKDDIIRVVKSTPGEIVVRGRGPTKRTSRRTHDKRRMKRDKLIAGIDEVSPTINGFLKLMDERSVQPQPTWSGWPGSWSKAYLDPCLRKLIHQDKSRALARVQRNRQKQI